MWIDGIGLFQTSSPTRYVRGEVIHMPEITEPIRPLTPRVEYMDKGELFTNLYERAGQFSAQKGADGHVRTAVAGEMKNEKLLPGGVAYRLSHDIGPSTLTKRVELRYHDRQPVIDIVEPLVAGPGLEVVQRGPRAVDVTVGGRVVTIELTEGSGDVRARRTAGTVLAALSGRAGVPGGAESHAATGALRGRRVRDRRGIPVHGEIAPRLEIGSHECHRDRHDGIS